MSFGRPTSKKRTDWLTVLLYFLLVAVGVAAVYTSNYNPEQQITWSNFLDFQIGKQMAWVVMSFILILVVQLFDRKFYINISPILYIISVLLLIAVLIFGVEISGSQSWFQLGPLRFQPSEIAKVGTALMVAYYLSDFNVNVQKTKDFLITAAIIAIPMGLILLQSDAGTALVYTSFILVLFREGLSPWFLITYASVIALFVLTLVFTQFDPVTLDITRSGFKPLAIGGGILMSVISALYFWKQWANIAGLIAFFASVVLVANFVEDFYLLGFLGVACVFFFFLYFRMRNQAFLFASVFSLAAAYVQTVASICQTFLEGYQLKRILVLLNIIKDPRGAGYNLEQSKIAIGSGGWTGKGYLNGTYVRSGFVPEVDTDFIFCNIGEEFGFMGSLILIGLFFCLLFRIVVIAERQKSKFTRIFAYAVASIFFFHFLINIAMTIGLAPVIGIPLPLISYGGSSFLGFSLLIFILIRLDSEKKNVVR